LLPNEKEVAAKVMDGEAIIINLANGTYYSMDNVGGLIWEMIEQNSSLGDIGSEIVAKYKVSRAQADPDVEQLASELLQENLVVVSNDEAPYQVTHKEEPETRQTYESPHLNIYRDMADLLALDPPIPGFPDTPWEE